MGINVARVKGSQQPIEEVYDQSQLVSNLAASRWPSLTDSVCLRFVQPWGDAVFNQLQIPVLLSELRGELRNPLAPEVRAQLEKVAGLVERAVGQSHVYVKFIGD